MSLDLSVALEKKMVCLFWKENPDADGYLVEKKTGKGWINKVIIYDSKTVSCPAFPSSKKAEMFKVTSFKLEKGNRHPLEEETINVDAPKLLGKKDGLQKVNDVWVYLKNGKIDKTYTGMARNKYDWWYITDGMLDLTYTGLASNEYGLWYITDGRLDHEFTGIASNDNGQWYFNKGKLQKGFTGSLEFEKVIYKIKDGKVE